MTWNKNNSAGYLANHMARLFAAGLTRRISPLGIAPAQFMILLELWDEDGLTQRDLVDRLDLEQATVANTLSRMERDGLITRRASPNDGRARIVELTQASKEMREEATQAAMAQNRAALSGLTVEEQAQLVGLMQRVIDGMRRG
ncbi:MarR family transcriptional regulator [Alisedimentitalea sp. MJ-SS2]|uniref:MarR family winged helix-turn-helix transcriptional regulator n=1 Tax=Aliisedimentitalea sp. MJ-SS2 TaxID=3049795 RepID=UPI002909BE1D|nr:MarR family transcriptional regulator [Alisedimentitalea sp. MJ-SS2]MDU8927523.1 MarR family transcriptional regulator [Alisedimentitalea sp. MJ-SS2]